MNRLQAIFQPCNNGFFPDSKRNFPSFPVIFSRIFTKTVRKPEFFTKTVKPGMHAGFRPFLTFFIHPASNTSQLVFLSFSRTPSSANERPGRFRPCLFRQGLALSVVRCAPGRPFRLFSPPCSRKTGRKTRVTRQARYSRQPSIRIKKGNGLPFPC